MLLSSESFTIRSPEKIFTINVRDVRELTISSDINNPDEFILMG